MIGLKQLDVIDACLDEHDAAIELTGELIEEALARVEELEKRFAALEKCLKPEVARDEAEDKALELGPREKFGPEVGRGWKLGG